MTYSSTYFAYDTIGRESREIYGHQAATSGVIAITEMAKAAYSPISRGINI